MIEKQYIQLYHQTGNPFALCEDPPTEGPSEWMSRLHEVVQQYQYRFNKLIETSETSKNALDIKRWTHPFHLSVLSVAERTLHNPTLFYSFWELFHDFRFLMDSPSYIALNDTSESSIEAYYQYSHSSIKGSSVLFPDIKSSTFTEWLEIESERLREETGGVRLVSGTGLSPRYETIMALRILRPDGHYVLRLPDGLTRSSLEIVYLLTYLFKQVNIIRPYTIHPASSQKYVVCKSFVGSFPLVMSITDYLWNYTTTNKVPTGNLGSITSTFNIPSDWMILLYTYYHPMVRQQCMILEKMTQFCHLPNSVSKQYSRRFISVQQKLSAEWNLKYRIYGEWKYDKPSSTICPPSESKHLFCHPLLSSGLLPPGLFRSPTPSKQILCSVFKDTPDVKHNEWDSNILNCRGVINDHGVSSFSQPNLTYK